MLEQLGRNWWICKQDLKSYFYSYRVDPSLWTYLGVIHPVTQQTMIMPVLTMGNSLSPPIATENSNILRDLIAKEATRRIGVRGSSLSASCVSDRDLMTAAYIDDFAHATPSQSASAEMLEIGATIFSECGFTEKLVKRETASQRRALLGLLFDTQTGILSLPNDKRQDLGGLVASMITRFDNNQCVSLSELESLVGKLIHACQAVDLGGSYVRKLRKPVDALASESLSRSKRATLHVPLQVVKGVRDELAWWETVLSQPTVSRSWFLEHGRYRRFTWDFNFGASVPRDVIQCYSDASGFGGGFLDDANTWNRREWSEGERKRLHINIREAVMISEGVEARVERWAGRKVLIWTDNSVSAAAFKKGYSRSPVITALVRRTRLACVTHDVHLVVGHIPGVLNFDSDRISRNVLGIRTEMFRLASPVLRQLTWEFGPFSSVLQGHAAVQAKEGALVFPGINNLALCLDHAERLDRCWALMPTHILKVRPGWVPLREFGPTAKLVFKAGPDRTTLLATGYTLALCLFKPEPTPTLLVEAPLSPN